jgi:hypothetical protein
MARSATSARHRLTFHPPRRRLHDALQQRESLVAVSIGTFRYFAGKPSGMPQALAVRRVERRQHSVEHAIPLRRGALQVRAIWKATSCAFHMARSLGVPSLIPEPESP